MNYCLGCHSLQYSRYNRVGTDLGIPEDLLKEHLMFDPGQKAGAHIDSSMNERTAKAWFGAPPPDLTLASRARQPEWLYTYLRTFYRDDSRPYGVNNKVFKDVGMPHVLLELQGMQTCAPGPVKAHNGGVKRDPLTAEEFDSAMYDLVNFLAYSADPVVVDRERIGTYVLLFITLFFVFACLLNREYWKDVH
jgi:ubiquinol-cytochrome c reductase cytochrome b subunit